MSARVALVAVVLVSVACAGRGVSLPPHGEALVVVDTDLPVPQLASRLRVDTYADDGTWLDSRDIGRSDPSDWPASFSVVSGDDARDRLVLVRLRAYADGLVRDYRGERFEARPTFQPPHAAVSLADLCAAAPDLPLGGRVTQRAGGAALTELIAHGSCQPPTLAGSVAARVTIATAGTYRFDVAATVPYPTNTTLFLRSRCDDPSSQLACDAEPAASLVSSGHFPRFDVQLQPGTYTLMTGGPLPDWPSDVTLEVLPVNQPLPPPAEADAGADAGDGGAPPLRLAQGDAGDVTPTSEPLPGASVDRLVLLRLVPGRRGRVDVTLHGACAGTMALPGRDPDVPDPATARTCIDAENVRVPLVESPLDPDMAHPDASAQDTFGPSEPCPEGATGSSTACIPGGVFVFGSRLVTGAEGTRDSSVPERIAVVYRFWMDRDEVTVARFRDAVAKGLTFDSFALFENDSVLGALPDLSSWCTWSKGPMERESFAVSCISWSLARRFCQQAGGDLPTEVQWEYAAGAAGRSFRTLFPWGNDPPTCAGAIFGRAPPGIGGGSSSCAAPVGAAGPAPVGAAAGDVTPNGVVGLAGGVGEWTRDSGHAYDDDCWHAAGLENPSCDEADAPFRSIRGGSWLGPFVAAPVRSASTPPEVTGSGQGQPPNRQPPLPTVGFRCVYPGATP